MDLNQVTVYASEEALELVGYALSQVGINQYEIIESADTVQHFLDETAANWDYVEASSVLSSRMPCVRAYLSQNETGMDQLAKLRARIEQLREEIVGLDPGPLSIEIGVVHEEDWANNWKQYYKPTCIGEKLLIKPSWEELDDDGGRIVLNMDPGMVFGTGTHETTQLSLLALEKAVQPGARVYDLGCGSGILAIGALLLGAQTAIGVDIDPNAKDIAYVNLEANGLAQADAAFITGDVVQDDEVKQALHQPADIVVANIVAGVIIPLSKHVPALLKPGGCFITSGIISDRRDEVVQAMEEAGLTLVDEHEKNDWVCLIGKKKAV